MIKELEKLITKTINKKKKDYNFKQIVATVKDDPKGKKLDKLSY